MVAFSIREYKTQRGVQVPHHEEKKRRRGSTKSDLPVY